ncbi:Breast cancer anti-estrogen resistance protein [Dirofilaria immitis]
MNCCDKDLFIAAKISNIKEFISTCQLRIILQHVNSTKMILKITSCTRSVFFFNNAVIIHEFILDYPRNRTGTRNFSQLFLIAH